MQTLESLGVPATFLIPHTQHTMPEAPNAVPPGWVHPQQQGFPTMDQQQGVGLNQPQSNHIFVMNNVKPEQSIPRREEAITSPPPPSPSVITATYNPTYNRCLPKILSDLDCEMKIKQVLRCIENILLENGDVDLQQQAYKLPDRSSSPQFAKSSTKKPKFKEDEEMLLSPNGPAINLPLATNSPASLINKASASKNPIKINVKVEPEAEKAAQHGVRPPFPEPQSLPNGSPRAQMFDFSYKQHQSPAPQGFPQQAHVGQPQRFGFDNSYSSPSPSHPAQPMIPHIQLSMSSPHLTAPSATSSPHLHHLHASSPHIHNSHVNSPHLAHSPLAHANSPHLVHSPHPHSPLVASQASPHLPAASPHLPSASPLTQFQVITNPNPHPEPAAHSDSMMSDFQYPPLFDGVQAGGHPAPQKKEHNMQDYVLDPALFAQYLAQNQQQLQQLQQQLQQQQQQHNQLQQQQRLQQHAPSPAQPTTSTTPAAPSSAAAQPTPSTQAPAAASASANASAPAAAATTSTTTAHQQPPVPINAPLHLFDTAHHPLAGSAHPITLSGHMSFSGHLLNQIGPDGIRLEEDDKWILSLLNMDSNIAHDLSLSGHIPPL